MITVNGEKATLDFIRKYNLTYNMVSVQEIIDELSSLKPPEGRDLGNVPFGLLDKNGHPRIIYEEDRKNFFAIALHKAFPVLMNFSKGVGTIISSKDEVYKELETLRKENEILKSRLSRVKDIVK